MEKPAVLTKDTLMPIGAVIVIFGAATWITTIFVQGQANAAQIKEIKETQIRDVDRIYEKLERIEHKIDVLKEKQK